jgi:hypothetical protein
MGKGGCARGGRGRRHFTIPMNSAKLRLMQPPTHATHRATLEDVPALRQLWTATQLPEPDLEKRFTEFQVALAPDGRVVAAIGLHVAGLHGLIHSEAMVDPASTDTLRPLLWARLQSVARNLGLVRLWTLEGAPYWRGQGFEPPDDAARAKFPASFGDPAAAWHTLKLKEDVAVTLSPDHEFALFRDTAKADSQRVIEQARIAKVVALVIAVIFALVVLGAGISYVWYINYKQMESGGNVPPRKKSEPAPAKKQPAPASPAPGTVPPPPKPQ